MILLPLWASYKYTTLSMFLVMTILVLFNSTKMLLVGIMRVLMHEEGCMMMHRGEGNYFMI